MNRLSELRKGLYTQAQMAELLGVSRSTYTKYESGDIQMGADVLEKLSDIFGVSTDYLLGRDAPAAADEDEEIWALREQLRRRPEMRTLLSIGRNATADDIRKAIAILDALRTPTDYDDPA